MPSVVGGVSDGLVHAGIALEVLRDLMLGAATDARSLRGNELGCLEASLILLLQHIDL